MTNANTIRITVGTLITLNPFFFPSATGIYRIADTRRSFGGVVYSAKPVTSGEWVDITHPDLYEGDFEVYQHSDSLVPEVG